MEPTKTLPTSTNTPVGNASHTSTRPASNLSGAEKENNTLLQSPKPVNSAASMPAGNPSLKNSNGKKLPTADDARTTMTLVAVSTLNWLLVRILYLGLGSVGKAENAEYYEIRLPTRTWKHENGVFVLVGNVGNSESESK